MDKAAVVGLTVQVSIGLTVLAVALRTGRNAARKPFWKPGVFLRALLAMQVLTPLFALALVTMLDLEPALKVALIAISVSPVSPLLPRGALEAGGRESYAMALLLTSAAASVITVPVSLHLAGGIFDLPAQVAPAAVGRIVLITVLAPLALGVLARSRWPSAAPKAAHPIAIVGAVLLVGALLPLLASALPQMISLVGNGTLITICLYVLAGLAFGHLLGGNEPDTRMVLAMATAGRHPGVAILVGGIGVVAPAQVAAAVLLYLIVSMVGTSLYQRWIKWGAHRAARPPAAPAPGHGPA
jgi:bile acid:Na+ symporter, BASS family